MTLVSSVTARYAAALFELAAEKGQSDAVARDVETLRAQLAARALEPLFDPRSPAAARGELLGRVTAPLSPLTANFVRLLSAKNRLEVLRELPGAFHQRQLAARNAVEGVAESARPLGMAELAALGAGLGRALNKTVELQNRVRPELVGGVRVLVDNRLLEGSVVGRLDSLRTRLMNAPLE